MRLAYADPPYIGKAKKHYSDDPSGIEAREVDYPALIEQLRAFDGWALPMKARAGLDLWHCPNCGRDCGTTTRWIEHVRLCPRSKGRKS